MNNRVKGSFELPLPTTFLTVSGTDFALRLLCRRQVNLRHRLTMTPSGAAVAFRVGACLRQVLMLMMSTINPVHKQGAYTP
jgi:hypothetical protein